MFAQRQARANKFIVDESTVKTPGGNRYQFRNNEISGSTLAPSSYNFQRPTYGTQKSTTFAPRYLDDDASISSSMLLTFFPLHV